MRIVFAADGSKHTKKALAFLATHEALADSEDLIHVINVQPTMPPHVRRMAGAATIKEYQAKESELVLEPIRKFLEKRGFAFRFEAKTGEPAEQILAAAKRTKAQMIVMGTHGYGGLKRAVMGSVAQRVLHDADIPVLLVK